ncbi:unnamed protein product, partial [Rotaria sp. Silwood2]
MSRRYWNRRKWTSAKMDFGESGIGESGRRRKKISAKMEVTVFIGSFVWKDVSSSTVNMSVTTSSAYSFSTQSYIVAITNATQTEI